MKRTGRALAGLALVAAFAFSLAGAVPAADRGRSNVGWVSPRFADYAVTRIGLGGLSSVERDQTNEKLFKDGLERAFFSTKYRFQSLTTFQDATRLGGIEAAVAALRKAAFDGVAPDSATLAALRGKLAVDAVLFVNLTRMERNLIGPDTRGQASTDVGAEFVLAAVKDGAVLWRGNFAERGLGPYNDPNVADVGQRDPTGNAQPRTGALDPPEFPEVVEKLMRVVTASLPAPPAPKAAAAAPAPAAPAAPATSATQAPAPAPAH